MTPDLGIQFAWPSYLTPGTDQWPAYSPQYWTPGTIVNARVRSGYGYYPQTGQWAGTSPADGYIVAAKISALSPLRPILTEIIYEWTQITHRTGRVPSALNVVWGDGHASTCTKPAVFDRGPAWWNVAAGLGAGPGEPGEDQGFLNIMAAMQP